MGKNIRGRMNRASYWVIVGIAILALTVVTAVGGHVPFLEMFLVFACVPRLHDMGRSGWWAIIPFLTEIVAAVIGIVFFADIFEMVLGIAVLVIGMMLIAIGLPPGDDGENAYGPPPPRGVDLWGKKKAAAVEKHFE